MKRPTNRELSKDLDSARREITIPRSQNKMQQRIDQLEVIMKIQNKVTNYYDNSNTQAEITKTVENSPMQGLRRHTRTLELRDGSTWHSQRKTLQ